MTRQLITALIVAVSSTVAASNLEADCGGHGCHTAFSISGFHARFGCSPREAFLLFQKQPELITRFPEMAQFLQAQFGSFTTTTPATAVTLGATPAAAAVTTTETTVVGAGNAAAVDPAPAPATAPPAAVTPADPAPAIDAAATTPTTPAAADGAEVAAPVAADPVADAAAPATAPPIQSELEPLLGLWVNESNAADQQIAKFNLNSDGNATVTVNTPLGQTEITKPFAIDDDAFKLDGNILAKVVSVDAKKVVLDANGTNLTFIRP